MDARQTWTILVCPYCGEPLDGATGHAHPGTGRLWGGERVEVVRMPLLVGPGDLLQSSASRLAEWVAAQADAVPYEVQMAVHEAQSAVNDWTDARSLLAQEGGE